MRHILGKHQIQFVESAIVHQKVLVLYCTSIYPFAPGISFYEQSVVVRGQETVPEDANLRCWYTPLARQRGQETLMPFKLTKAYPLIG